MKKKTLALLLAAAMVLGLTACGGAAGADTAPSAGASADKGAPASDKTWIIATDTSFKPFEYTDDNKVHRLTTDWGMAGYTQGTFFNVTQTDDVDFNQWDEVEELNEKATPSEMLGFNLDTSNIETELANCRAVYEKYYSELFTGAQDPRELVKTIDAELETAGWETIREEAQKQIDAQK